MRTLMRRSTPRFSHLEPPRNSRGIAFGSISNLMESDDLALTWELEFRRCLGALHDFPRCSANSFNSRNNGAELLLPGAQLGHLALQIRGEAFEDADPLFAALQCRFELGHLAKKAVFLALHQLDAHGRQTVEAMSGTRANL